MLTEPVAIFYTSEVTDGVVTQGEDLKIDNIRLSPWRLTSPSCTDCLISIRVDDRPSGPSHQMTLSQADQIYWGFINGKTTPYQTDIGRLSFVDNQLYLQTDPHQPAIELSEPITVEDCRYQLLWLQRPPDVAAGISNEQPAVHYQVLYSCD